MRVLTAPHAGTYLLQSVFFILNFLVNVNGSAAPGSLSAPQARLGGSCSSPVRVHLSMAFPPVHCHSHPMEGGLLDGGEDTICGTHCSLGKEKPDPITTVPGHSLSSRAARSPGPRTQDPPLSGALINFDPGAPGDAPYRVCETRPQ